MSCEPLKLRRTTKLEHPRPRISQRSIIATYKYKIPRDRCAKATNSKAVGGTQPTALPSSSMRTVFLDGHRRVVETTVKVMRSSQTHGPTREA